MDYTKKTADLANGFSATLIEREDGAELDKLSDDELLTELMK